MTPAALLVLATLAGGPAPALPLDAAMRIAACGPSETDRALLDQQVRSANYDHLGGGFHDFPGGPKRLETNAWLLNAIVTAHEAKPDLFLRNTALDTVAFVLRDLKDAAGGFFASIGNAATTSYYAFSEQEVRSALGPDKSREFFENFTLAPGGFPQLTGSPFAGLGDTRQTLLLRRLRRIRLPLDDTIDPDANGVWIGALARAAVTLKRRDFVEAAQRAAGVASGSQRPKSAGTAFGIVELEHFDRAFSAEAAAKALDRAVERSPRMGAAELATLSWALAEWMRLHPSDIRSRQFAGVISTIERQFATTEAAAAARCVAATVKAKAP